MSIRSQHGNPELTLVPPLFFLSHHHHSLVGFSHILFFFSFLFNHLSCLFICSTWIILKKLSRVASGPASQLGSTELFMQRSASSLFCVTVFSLILRPLYMLLCFDLLVLGYIANLFSLIFFAEKKKTFILSRSLTPAFRCYCFSPRSHCRNLACPNLRTDFKR